VDTSFNAFVFQGCEESIDTVGATVGCLRVEEAGEYEALDDSSLSSEGLLALESINLGTSRLDGMRDSLVCPNGRVMNILGVRSSRCGRGRRTNRRHNCFERRVRGRKVNDIAR
jgi:hypothetical protein